MSQRVSLSRRDAQVLRDLIESTEEARVRMSAIEHRAVASLRSALSPRPKKPMRQEREAAKAQKKATKRERRASVREQVMARADGVCECGCFHPMTGGIYWEPTLDHFWGRSREESVESCWALASGHHRAKTDNAPDREMWLRLFRKHCVRCGYAKQVAKVDRELAVIELSRASAEAGKGAR